MDCSDPILKNYNIASKGYSILINHRSKDILKCSDGSIENLNFEYSIDTLYDLASLTKVLCTLPLTLILLDRNIISLRDTLGSLDLFDGYPNIQKLNFESLLTHTSGLIPDKNLWEFGKERDDYLRGIEAEAKNANPYAEESYSDLNFILLGFALEKIYGKTLDEIFKSEIADKIGLKFTGFNPEFSREIIAPTEIYEDRGLVWGKVHDEKSYYLGGVAGHAGLFSNAKEILKILNAMREGILFSRKTFDLSIVNRNSYVGGIFGLGWMVKSPRFEKISKSYDLTGFMGDYAPYGTIGHTGFTGTSLLLDESHDLTVILLTNRVYPTRQSEGILRFRRIIHNRIYHDI
ncbi:MAG: serine hydrolase domain-containing protein [Thermoplasmata archaeon]